MFDVRWLWFLLPVLLIALAGGFFQFLLCKADGYNNTQCMMMLQNPHAVAIMGN
jgi:hypothetical protein